MKKEIFKKLTIGLCLLIAVVLPLINLFFTPWMNSESLIGLDAKYFYIKTKEIVEQRHILTSEGVPLIPYTYVSDVLWLVLYVLTDSFTIAVSVAGFLFLIIFFYGCVSFLRVINLRWNQVFWTIAATLFLTGPLFLRFQDETNIVSLTLNNFFQSILAWGVLFLSLEKLIKRKHKTLFALTAFLTAVHPLSAIQFLCLSFFFSEDKKIILFLSVIVCLSTFFLVPNTFQETFPHEIKSFIPILPGVFFVLAYFVNFTIDFLVNNFGAFFNKNKTKFVLSIYVILSFTFSMFYSGRKGFIYREFFRVPVKNLFSTPLQDLDIGSIVGKNPSMLFILLPWFTYSFIPLLFFINSKKRQKRLDKWFLFFFAAFSMMTIDNFFRISHFAVLTGGNKFFSGMGPTRHFYSISLPPLMIYSGIFLSKKKWTTIFLLLGIFLSFNEVYWDIRKPSVCSELSFLLDFNINSIEVNPNAKLYIGIPACFGYTVKVIETGRQEDEQPPFITLKNIEPSYVLIESYFDYDVEAKLVFENENYKLFKR